VQKPDMTLLVERFKRCCLDAESQNEENSGPILIFSKLTYWYHLHLSTKIGMKAYKIRGETTKNCINKNCAQSKNKKKKMLLSYFKISRDRFHHFELSF
jgi:hypothetical protein